MEQGSLRIGFIGYGAIAQEVARLLSEGAVADMTLVGALVRQPDHARPPGAPLIVTTHSALLAEHPHVVVEVAGHEGLREHGPAILRAGIDLILVSAGALAEPYVLNELLDGARASGAHVKVASGAIGALDALAAASIGGLTRVIHTLRKPPAALLGREEAARLTGVSEVFRGSARQATQRFPEFLNVAAAVALASNGFDQTEVRVLADPAVNLSVHEIQAEGAFGKLRFEIENAPIRHVGRGAQLVAMSIIHALQLRSSSLMIG
jgi:aspartate dehydrogenase